MDEALLAALLGSATIRGYIEDLAMKVIADVFHRRSVDPEYLKQSDAVFAQRAAAKTVADKDAAQDSLRKLLNPDAVDAPPAA